MKRRTTPVHLTPEEKKTKELLQAASSNFQALTPRQFREWRTSRLRAQREHDLRGIENWCKRDLPTLSIDQLKRLILRAKKELLQRKKTPHRPPVGAERMKTAITIHALSTNMGFSSAEADTQTAMLLVASPKTIERYRSTSRKKSKKS